MFSSVHKRPKSLCTPLGIHYSPSQKTSLYREGLWLVGEWRQLLFFMNLYQVSLET